MIAAAEIERTTGFRGYAERTLLKAYRAFLEESADVQPVDRRIYEDTLRGNWRKALGGFVYELQKELDETRGSDAAELVPNAVLRIAEERIGLPFQVVYDNSRPNARFLEEAQFSIDPRIWKRYVDVLVAERSQKRFGDLHQERIRLQEERARIEAKVNPRFANQLRVEADQLRERLLEEPHRQIEESNRRLREDGEANQRNRRFVSLTELRQSRKNQVVRIPRDPTTERCREVIGSYVEVRNVSEDGREYFEFDPSSLNPSDRQSVTIILNSLQVDNRRIEIKDSVINKSTIGQG